VLAAAERGARQRLLNPRARATLGRVTPDADHHELRASDADRDEAVERLRVAALEGRLDPHELEERMTAAYAARHCSELTRLTADVTPPPPPALPARPTFVRTSAPTNGLAIASLIAGVFWMWWIGSVVAVVLGHIALGQIARKGQSGRGLAIAGLVLGYIGLAVLVLVGLAATL
jgi:Domain of unknown function (DUF4190)/Domain of unknown function (DUF1707)